MSRPSLLALNKKEADLKISTDSKAKKKRGKIQIQWIVHCELYFWGEPAYSSLPNGEKKNSKNIAFKLASRNSNETATITVIKVVDEKKISNETENQRSFSHISTL